MASVAGSPDGEGEVRTLAQLAIHAPIGLDDAQSLVGVQAPCGMHRRDPVGVAGHQHRRVAAVANKEFEQASADSDVSLLLLPADVLPPTERTPEGARLELAEVHAGSAGLEGGEVRDLVRDRARVLGLAMVRKRREVQDADGWRLTWDRVQEGVTQADDVELVEWTADDALALAQRVVHAEAVDKEDAAVDDDPRKGRTPGSQPRGGHGMYPWGRM